ncbi:MAG: nucleotidyl transferase AbiEii/AbiGii toxin family protein [Candidatus Gracilibacteria bacterium]|jgi:predicted nucleotidyltransferase component of viral defense system
MNILIEKLKNVVSARRAQGTPDNVIINALKEELQYPVLDFIYNNKEYSNLIMYGGTLLRIAYGLPRMSEDLDFQTNKKFNLKKFAENIASHFKTTYDLAVEMKIKTEQLTGTDFAYIKFPNILEEIGLKGHGIWTKLQIRFDINKFSQALDFPIEQIPVTKDTYAFSIKTYTISTLMASKIAAVLLRGKRGIGNEMSDCKPRDIYDLMWYMDQKIIPDMDYLKAIHARVKMNMEATNVLELFDILLRHVGNLDDKLFTHDLSRFFYNPFEFEDWHRNWRERFRILRNSYEIYKIKKINNKPDLLEVRILANFSNNSTYFYFNFSTEEPINNRVRFICGLSEYWYIFGNFRILNGHRKKEIENFIKSNKDLTELDYEYAGLFYEKIEDCLKRNDYILLQPELRTKLIRATADNFNVKTEILLDNRLLLKEKFENLL